jgi:hypothetical protein
LSATNFTFNAGTSTNIILDTTAATNVDNTNYFYIGTNADHIKYTNGNQFQIVANGTPIMTIGNNTYELTSGNMLINLSTGQISADAFTLYTESFKLSSSHITAPTEGDLQKWYGNEPTEETPNPKGNIIFNSNNKFAITDAGHFYAEAGKIANWNVGNNYLTAGELGKAYSFHMYSNKYGKAGAVAGYNVVEASETTPGWALTIG